MTGISAALVTVFLTIALGAALRRYAFQNEDAWRVIDRLNYFVFFPSLLFTVLAGSDLSAVAIGPVAMAALSGLAIATALVLGLQAVLKVPGPQFASLFQGALRWNGFVALAAVAGVVPEGGLPVVAIVVAVLVPILNILSVVVLSRSSANGPTPLARLPGTLARNPLIIACLSGMLLNRQGLLLDSPLGATLETLGRAATPLGLIGVGAGLNLAALRGRTGLIATATVFKLIAMPFLFAAMADVFGLEGAERTVVIICGTVPGATSSYVLARQLGGDATLMAGMVTASTLAALITMPALLWLLT